MSADHLNPAPGIESSQDDRPPAAQPSSGALTIPPALEPAVLAFLAGTPAPLAAARASVPVAELIELAERYQAAGRAALTSDRAAANWHQVEIEFPDRYTAERTVATRIAPRLRQAEDSGVVTSWWYIRKTPHWRLRLRPDESQRQLRAFVTQMLDELASKRFVVAWSSGIYEPESCVFGGPEGMEAAHRLFHADSANALAYLRHVGSPRNPQSPLLGRRELSVLLCTTLLRAAGQDWHEQADVWHRVTRMRPLATKAPGSRLLSMAGQVHRLLTLDTERIAVSSNGQDPLAPVRPWFAAMSETGVALRGLARTGVLHRGLRDVLAHHVIFHWNRVGLTTMVQAVLAHAATVTMLDSSVDGNAVSRG
ncbi:thiopeptide-type bacteriocin biosynthesis protein [Micromonospora sp. NPDC048830]|uniref:thiopeptide-type bacteriocin biosynthesis protein n=1 Tax=Micromonospora sp. NPDC048830 TaxID=3364257 RepID=UPI0037142458